MNQGPAVSPQVGTTGEYKTQQQTGSSSAGRQDNVESGGMQQPTENSIRTARVTGGEVLEQAKERLRTFKQDTDDYVRKNPSKAIFTALGIGFVLGLLRRR
jgi:ElaB/YqjD/DUF883 family membrane-anchored ribosome-binding protein